MTVSSPSSWDLVLVPAALDSERPIIRPKAKIAARDYRLSGRYPIIDQGQNDIAGWTNSEDAVLPVTRPVIVFGDHSRTFKYVDHAFAAGADGTLILNPAKEFDPRFLYFACVGLEIPSRGYNRHYSMLKEMSVPRPPPAEQRAIADILSKVQEAIETDGQLVRVTRELKHAALRQLFTRGLRGEPQKETEIGPVPESWDVLPVADCVVSFRFNRSQQIPASQYANAGRFPIVDQGQAVIAGYCDDEGKVIRPYEPLVIFGDHTRCLKFVDFPFVLGADGTKPLQARSEWDTKALFYALSAVKLESRGYNRHFKHFSEKLVARPKDKDEQREIAALLGTIDAKLAHHEARQKLLRELFRTLLHDLMTARRRVVEFDSKALVS